MKIFRPKLIACLIYLFIAPAVAFIANVIYMIFTTIDMPFSDSLNGHPYYGNPEWFTNFAEKTYGILTASTFIASVTLVFGFIPALFTYLLHSHIQDQFSTRQNLFAAPFIGASISMMFALSMDEEPFDALAFMGGAGAIASLLAYLCTQYFFKRIQHKKDKP
ncbi:MAG: hypothetical protein Q4E16_02565 [Neisseria sp.]|nr:hypothetical protein [Neisseria sp.]